MLSHSLTGFPGGSVVKNPPAMREVQVRSLGREDPLEKERQPAPVLLPVKSQGQRSLAGYSAWGHRRVGNDLVTKNKKVLD